MGKEKKQSGQQWGGKGGKGIHKDNPHYGYSQQQQRNSYNRPADKRPIMPQYSSKPRPSANNLPPPPSNSKNNPKIPRTDQISESVVALGALEAVLNSYEQLELDKCENVGEIVEAIMKKKMPLPK